MKSTGMQQAWLKFMFQGVAPTLPTSPLSFALVVAAYGSWTASTAVATTGELVSPTTPNGHFYELTTAGTTGTTEPVWPTAPGATVTDGTAVWTEASSLRVAGTLPEVSGGGYARATLAVSSTNFPLASYTGSTYLGQKVDNGAVVSYGSGSTTGNWGLIVGVMVFDSSATPVFLGSGVFGTAVQVNSGDPFPQFPIAAMNFIEK